MNIYTIFCLLVAAVNIEATKTSFTKLEKNGKTIILMEETHQDLEEFKKNVQSWFDTANGFINTFEPLDKFRARMDKLLESIGNVNLGNQDGNTALMLAAANPAGGIRLVNYLLSKPQIDINATNDIGETALMRAARYGHDEIAKLLFDNGAKLDIENNIGENALAMSKIYDHPTTTDFLRKTIAILIKQAFDELFAYAKISPTAATSDAERQRIVARLKSIFARISPDNIVDESGNTILDKAFSLNCTEIIFLLLQYAHNPQDLLARFPFEVINPTTDLFKYFIDLAYGIEPMAKPKIDELESSKIKQCAVCKIEASKHCGRCKKVYYCGADHQKADWQAHKTQCGKYLMEI